MLAGCGSSSSDEEKSPAREKAEQKALERGSGRTSAKSHINPPPKGSPLMVRELYREFPPPQVPKGVKGAAAAVRAGERACAGKTPAQVAERYLPVALEKGTIKEGTEQAKMIAETGRFQKNIETEASFTSGQLAAGAYQATLPPRLQKAGYQGCIYSLARGLEHRLYPPAGE